MNCGLKQFTQESKVYDHCCTISIDKIYTTISMKIPAFSITKPIIQWWRVLVATSQVNCVTRNNTAQYTLLHDVTVA